MTKRDSIINISFFLIFFLIETVYYQEILLFVLLLLIVAYNLITSNFKNLKLFSVGLFLGILIEWYLGTISRSQFWSNTLFLPIPIWLPLIWGYGFVVIHEIGKTLDKM